jgi:hypothetical protein
MRKLATAFYLVGLAIEGGLAEPPTWSDLALVLERRMQRLEG